jgi:hypothetical protein
MVSRIILSMAFLLPLTGGAQEAPPATKPIFQTIVQAGVLEGQRGSAFQLQVVNGFRFGRTAAGIGVGLDYYALRSIPLFLDLRTRLLQKEASPFLYGNIGTHFPWASDGEQDWIWGWPSKVTREGGLYYELGLGYEVPLKKYGLLFSAGYSYKAFREEQEGSGFCPGPGPCPTQKQTFSYQLRRVSIRAGFRF